VIHLYAVADGLAELPPVPGLAEAPLERLRVEDLDVVVSAAAPELSEPAEADILRHALVIEELMRRSEAVLPGRLGRGFADESELTQAVQAEAERLRTALERVRGCVELGLRVLRTDRDGARVQPLTGSQYLRARLAEQRQLEREVAELHEPLAGLARASTCRSEPTTGQLFEAAYLLPLDRVGPFREEVARLESARPELDFVCTGPWPPYSFASGREKDE
jgi:Gas vesicle synthesis protein GvpL/GvpF